MRTAIYCRVSTNYQNCDLQLAELREYAGRRGFTVTMECIDDVSGSKESRPGLNNLMTACKQRRIDAVLVWKLDRFARSLKHLVNALDEFESLGIAFISLRDNLDLSTPSGRLMFQIIGAMAEFERALICERVKAGVQRKIASGKPWGRKRLDVTIPQGLSLRQAAHQLGVSRETVRRRLINHNAL